jgi:hypothetical protein
LTEVTIDLPENAKFETDSGDEYNDKVWLGLSSSDSLIASYVTSGVRNSTDIRLSATGAKKSKSRKCNDSNA